MTMLISGAKTTKTLPKAVDFAPNYDAAFGGLSRKTFQINDRETRHLSAKT